MLSHLDALKIAEEIKMPGRTDYEERRQARIERLQTAADKARSDSNAAYQRSHDLVKNIPLGQPNIVGRPALPRLRERSMNLMKKSIEADKKADYYDDRAETAENNTSISSDDPDAPMKLQNKVDCLRKQQERMKAINKYYRKHKTCVGMDGLADEEAARLDQAVKDGYSWETAPFPSYELTSINQRIKAAEARIKKLESVDKMPAEIIKFDGGEIESDPDTNRVLIRFDERQGEEVIEKLKGRGFRWAPSVKAWQRLRNPAALRAAYVVCGITRND